MTVDILLWRELFPLVILLSLPWISSVRKYRISLSFSFLSMQPTIERTSTLEYWPLVETF